MELGLGMVKILSVIRSWPDTLRDNKGLMRKGILQDLYNLGVKYIHHLALEESMPNNSD
jgi:hypothetical protein